MIGIAPGGRVYEIWKRLGGTSDSLDLREVARLLQRPWMGAGMGWVSRDLKGKSNERLAYAAQTLGTILTRASCTAFSRSASSSTTPSLITTDRYRRHIVNDLRLDLFKIDSEQPGFDTIEQ